MTLYVARHVVRDAELAAQGLLERRRAMTCTRYQGRLALGAARCADLDAYADDPLTLFALREGIRQTQVWHRLDEVTDEMMGYVLGLTPTEIDDVFDLAVSISQ